MRNKKLVRKEQETEMFPRVVEDVNRLTNVVKAFLQL